MDRDVTITRVKRHAALQPLSRDHHVALVAAQRLRRATDEDAATARRAFLEREGARSVESLHALGTALERHVRLEEREVFSLIEAALPPDAAEALVEAVLCAEQSRTRG
jgi:hypothetical protein